MKKIYSLLISLLALAGGTLTYCSLKPKEISGVQKSPGMRQRDQSVLTSLRFEKFLPVEYHKFIKAVGEVKALQDVSIIAASAGFVSEVSERMREGEEVQKGEVLFRVDDREYRLRAEQARASVAKAEYDLEVIKAQKRSAEESLQLFQSQQNQQKVAEHASASVSDLAYFKPQLLNAEAALRGAKASLEQALLQLERTVVRAPFRGTVFDVRVSVGQYLSGNQVVARLVNTENLEITTYLSINDIYSCMRAHGKNSLLGLPVGIVHEISGVRHEWQGFVRQVSAQVDGDMQTMKILVGLRSLASQARLRMPIGLKPTLLFDGGKLAHVYKLPLAALTPKNTLFVYKDEKVFERKVHVLERDERFAIVELPEAFVKEFEPLSSLQVAVRGLDFLHDGMQVSVSDEVQSSSSASERRMRGQRNKTDGKGENFSEDMRRRVPEEQGGKP